eukprot:2990095-Alexandrium_andersonii.AAC.1
MIKKEGAKRRGSLAARADAGSAPVTLATSAATGCHTSRRTATAHKVLPPSGAGERASGC